MIKVLHKKKDRAESGSYRGISLVAHASKVLFKIIATKFSACCEAKELLTKGQCGFRPHSSTSDIIFAVCRLQKLERKARAAVSVLHRPAEGIRFCRSYTPLAGARSLRSIAAYDGNNSPVLRWDESLRVE